MPVNITYFADLVDGPWMKDNPRAALQALDELVGISTTPRDDLWIVNGLGRILPEEITVRAQELGQVGAAKGEFEDFSAPAAQEEPRDTSAEIPFAQDFQRELKERLRSAQADRAKAPQKKLYAEFIRRVEAPLTRAASQPINPPLAQDSLESPVIPPVPAEGPLARVAGDLLSLFETPHGGEDALEEGLAAVILSECEDGRSATQRAADDIAAKIQKATDDFHRTRLAGLVADADAYSTEVYRALEARLAGNNLVRFPHALVPGGSDVVSTCKQHLGGHTLLHYTATTETLAIAGVRVYGQGAELADVPDMTRILVADRQEQGYTLTQTQPDIIVVSQIPTETDTTARRSLETFLASSHGKVVFVRNPRAAFSARVHNGNLIIEGTSFAMDTAYEHPGTFIVAQYEPAKQLFEPTVATRLASFRAYVLQVVPRFSGATRRLEKFTLRECYRVQWNGGDEVEVRKDRDFHPARAFDGLKKEIKTIKQ